MPSVTEHSTGRAGTNAERATIIRRTNGYEVVLEEDPDERYRPPQRPFWRKVLDRLYLGWHPPHEIGPFGRR